MVLVSKLVRLVLLCKFIQRVEDLGQSRPPVCLTPFPLKISLVCLLSHQRKSACHSAVIQQGYGVINLPHTEVLHPCTLTICIAWWLNGKEISKLDNVNTYS